MYTIETVPVVDCREGTWLFQGLVPNDGPARDLLGKRPTQERKGRSFEVVVMTLNRHQATRAPYSALAQPCFDSFLSKLGETTSNDPHHPVILLPPAHLRPMSGFHPSLASFPHSVDIRHNVFTHASCILRMIDARDSLIRITPLNQTDHCRHPAPPRRSICIDARLSTEVTVGVPTGCQSPRSHSPTPHGD